MNEFESTLGGKPPVSETCIVYDARSGRIVYTKEFIGDGKGIYRSAARADRERIALERVTRLGLNTARLRVLHTPRNFEFDSNTVYRFDPKAQELVVNSDVSKAGSPLKRKPGKRSRAKRGK